MFTIEFQILGLWFLFRMRNEHKMETSFADAEIAPPKRLAAQRNKTLRGFREAGCEAGASNQPRAKNGAG